MKKKILALCLVVALAATGIVGASMAYLTDEAGEMSNVFAIGDVDIKLTEEVSVDGAGKVDEREPDEYGDDTGASYTGVMPGDWLQKEVTVENTGANPAYVAVTVTVNNFDKIQAIVDAAGDDDANAEALLDEIFEGWGMTVKNRYVGENNDVKDMSYKIDNSEVVDEYILHVDSAKRIIESEVAHFSIENWYKSEAEAAADSYTVAGTNNSFYLKDKDDYSLCFTYYIDLPVGESVTLFKGLNVPAEFNNEQIEMFNGLKINVSAKAIQADNFATAVAAFSELNGALALGVYDAIVSNDTELASAVEAGKTEIWLNSGTYHAPAAAKGKTLTINGTKDAVLEVVPAGQGEANGQLDYSFDGSTVTFNGITIKTNSQLYAGYARLSGTYKDCVIQNTYNLGTGNSSFENCTFNITNEYLRVGGASSAVFDGCTFNTDGRAILVFQDGTSVAQKVTVKDCTFNATAAANTWNGIHVAAVSYDGSQGGTYTVNFEGNNTVDDDFNGLWQIKAGEANVTVTGLS